MTKLSDGTVVSSAFRRREHSLEHGIHNQPRPSNLKIGTVIAVKYIDGSDGLQKTAVVSSEAKDGTPYETVYDVKVDDMMARPFIYNSCRVLKSFYGPSNYFEVIHESADISPTYLEDGIYIQQAESLAGARCVLLFLEGQSTVPVILGFLTHPSRKSKITKDKGLHLGFEFNGFKVNVDKDGAFTLEAAGPLLPPIAPPAGPIPEIDVRLDPINGPLKIEIDKSFNFKLTDIIGQMISVTHDTPLSGVIEVGNGGDFIRIEKAIPGGIISVNSSKEMSLAALEMTIGATAKMDISTAQLAVTADVMFEIKTGNFDLKSDLGFALESMSAAFKVKTAFTAEALTFSFKGAAGELLALIYEIADGLGKITAASPVGPCAPLMAAPQWAAVQAALVKLKTITG